eukprot:127714-Pelagomonas_calceolata.AAC.1
MANYTANVKHTQGGATSLSVPRLHSKHALSLLLQLSHLLSHALLDLGCLTCYPAKPHPRLRPGPSWEATPTLQVHGCLHLPTCTALAIEILTLNNYTSDQVPCGLNLVNAKQEVDPIAVDTSRKGAFCRVIFANSKVI